jgi:hypothetical protein
MNRFTTIVGAFFVLMLCSLAEAQVFPSQVKTVKLPTGVNYAPLNSAKTINQTGTRFVMTRDRVERKENRQPQNSPRVPDENGRYCTTTFVSEEKGDFEKIVLTNQNDKIYPGAIYFDNAMVEGTYNAPSDLQLRPYEVVTDMSSAATAGSTAIALVQPNMGAYRDALATLMSRTASARTPSAVTVDVSSISTTEKLAFEVGASYQGYGVDLEADLNYLKRTGKNVFIARLKQVYFSVTTNSNVTGRTLVDNPTVGTNLIYVKKVNYGRIGYLMIASEESEENIRAALNFRYEGNGSRVGARGSLEIERTLNSMQIKGFYMGGDSQNSVRIDSPSQLADFSRYVQNGLRLDPNVVPTPVSYEMKYLDNNATAAVRVTTSYTERQCEPGKGVKVKLHNVAIDEIHGGDCSYAWGMAKVEVWETDSRGNLSKKIDASPGLPDDLFWNQPDGRSPLRAVVNYASIRRRDNVENGLLNAIGTERTYLLDPKAVSERRVLLRVSINVNTNHKDNDFASLGAHGMNRIETRDVFLHDVVKTSEQARTNADFKYGTWEVGKFCSNTDRVHCFYGLFSVTNAL